jgi:hypothetical protein
MVAGCGKEVCRWERTGLCSPPTRARVSYLPTGVTAKMIWAADLAAKLEPALSHKEAYK